jgi:hypothetical protein
MYWEAYSTTPEPGDDDYEESPYVRDPHPMVPSFVEGYGEEELRTLLRWHAQANLDDREKADGSRSKANALRAEARELDVKAKVLMLKASQGEAVVRDLKQSIEKERTERESRERSAIEKENG